MNEPHIILLPQPEGSPVNPLDLCVMNEDGNIAVFNSLDDACDYKEEHEISGLVFELPIID